MTEPQPEPVDDGDSQYYVEFGARLKAVRERKGFTQARLAEVIGLNRTSVVNVEAGRQRVHAHQLATCAAFLGVTADELLGTEPTGQATGHSVEFREAIPDSSGATKTWSHVDDLATVMSRMVRSARYAPVAEVRTVTTIYGDWQRLSLSPAENGEQQCPSK